MTDTNQPDHQATVKAVTLTIPMSQYALFVRDVNRYNQAMKAQGEALDSFRADASNDAMNRLVKAIDDARGFEAILADSAKAIHEYAPREFHMEAEL